MNWLNLCILDAVADDVDNDSLIDRTRYWRNAELAATDWTQLPDATADKTAYAIYRQELRDLMAQSEDARAFIFPIKP